MSSFALASLVQDALVSLIINKRSAYDIVEVLLQVWKAEKSRNERMDYFGSLYSDRFIRSSFRVSYAKRIRTASSLIQK